MEYIYGILNSCMDINKTVELVKNQEVSPDKIVSYLQSGASLVSGLVTVKTISFSILAIILLVVWMLNGLPYYIGGGLILIIIGFIALDFATFKRVRTVNLNQELNTGNSITFENDEKVIDYIVGIMRTGFGLRGFEFLGVGNINNPENALLVTDRQVIFIVIPVQGADKLIGGSYIGMWQWLLSKKNLEEKLKSLLASDQLKKVINLYPTNFSINKNNLVVRFGGKFNQTICFISGERKFCYALRDKKDYLKAKNIFAVCN